MNLKVSYHYFEYAVQRCGQSDYCFCIVFTHTGIVDKILTKDVTENFVPSIYTEEAIQGIDFLFFWDISR